MTELMSRCMPVIQYALNAVHDGQMTVNGICTLLNRFIAVMDASFDAEINEMQNVPLNRRTQLNQSCNDLENERLHA